jgi:hypothetical protein
MRGGKSYPLGTLDALKFAQFLAKIAHGFAVACLTVDVGSKMMVHITIRLFADYGTRTYQVFAGELIDAPAPYTATPCA